MKGDTYNALTQAGEAIYTEKRSKFYAFALPAETEEDVKRLLTEYRKKYYDARHACYAYSLGVDGSQYRANDDGEPSGTAGKPILGQIHSVDTTNVLVIVIRYFGGVKLGTGGLVVAYKTAAAAALANATIEEKIIHETLKMEVPYSDADTAMRFIREEGAEITGRDYTATSTILTASIRKRDLEKLVERLRKILSLTFIKEEDSSTEAEDL